MIQLYYHPSPNPAKVALCLEETGLDYAMIPVDTRNGEQFAPRLSGDHSECQDARIGRWRRSRVR